MAISFYVRLVIHFMNGEIRHIILQESTTIVQRICSAPNSKQFLCEVNNIETIHTLYMKQVYNYLFKNQQ